MSGDSKTPFPAKTGWKEFAWFVALWAIGVGTVLVIGGAIKLALG